jgi:hypothetical protein
VTPSFYAFWIWTLIHFLLLCMMVFQFTTPGKAIVIDSIAYRFALLGCLNSIYIFLWAKGWYISAFLFSLLLAAAVSQVYQIIDVKHQEVDGLGTELFVHLPFSLYHGCESYMCAVANLQGPLS